ncbi:MAG: type I-E CRISPR-associated protein Cas5/CasD [Hyphomicrobiaceae bacterium]|nr:type I-E CRISPR-associated protein Cas5/CasD [Hyphomicrobiaceae bacterium]
MTGASHRHWLVLRLEAPLVSFGAVAIDSNGVIWDFPALSMLTGLFANALGYERTEREAHQALQDRLVVASRRDDEPYDGVLTDVQNVQMQKSDKGWTTRGAPEGRDGGAFGGPHRRFRDYHPDALVAVVVTLWPPSSAESSSSRLPPSLDDLARALDRPDRPLFIGRKPCLPAFPLNAGTITAATAHAALLKLPPPVDRSSTPRRAARPRRTVELRAQWPAGEGPREGPLVDRLIALPDRRNWISGLHGGTRSVVEGRVRPDLPVREASK